jgi:serpin B
MVAALNAFSWDLYRQQSLAAAGNVFLSPLSAAAVLALAQRGASGETANEILRVLKPHAPEAEFHVQLGRLLQELSSNAASGHELSIANALFLDGDFDFDENYVDDVRGHLAAEIQRMPLRGHPKAVARVNAWVDGATRHKVPVVLDAIDPKTVALALNAVYFEGTWATPFALHDTRPRPFRVSETQTQSVDTMATTGDFRCAESSSARVLELPYRGDELSMVIVVPGAISAADGPGGTQSGPPQWDTPQSETPQLETQGAKSEEAAPWVSLADFEAGFSSAQFAKLAAALSPCHVEVQLPKFQFESALDLKALLRKLGMVSAFSDAADFSRMTAEPQDGKEIFIGEAAQRARIEVDEVGSRAAAVSALSYELESLPPTFAADRTFLFVIRDRVTDAMVFVGRVNDPSESGAHSPSQ